jgi:hypothetical protein
VSRYYDNDDPAPADLGHAIPKAETAAALLVIRADLSELWIPKSMIHDDSPCYSMKSGPGKLLVEQWWANKNGVC